MLYNLFLRRELLKTFNCEHDLEQSFHRLLTNRSETLYLTLLSTQGAKKVSFTACHAGKLKVAFTSPNVI